MYLCASIYTSPHLENWVRKGAVGSVTKAQFVSPPHSTPIYRRSAADVRLCGRAAVMGAELGAENEEDRLWL